MTTLYFSDPHFLHANIIQHGRRPFKHVDEMDFVLMEQLRKADWADHELVCCGDLTFDLRKFRQRYGPLFHNDANREQRLCVLGNHDNAKGARRDDYEAEFGTVIGTAKSWASNAVVLDDQLEGRGVRVLCSHAPQPMEVLAKHDADFNVYGHVHNGVLHEESRQYMGADQVRFLLGSETHLNASVELHAYKPVTLGALVERQRQLRAEYHHLWAA